MFELYQKYYSALMDKQSGKLFILFYLLKGLNLTLPPLTFSILQQVIIISCRAIMKCFT